jgi:TonB dependent receptor/TonB-dependent Receptor Plug Domain
MILHAPLVRPSICAVSISRAIATAAATIVLSISVTPALSAEDTTDTVVVTGTRMPGLSDTGANDYAITAQTIANLPAGENTAMTDVLAQMPGVGIDQNQQVHIRNTEGSGFQYAIDGVLVPLDINTNPPFVSMINPLFVARLDLIDGILPSQYSYSTGGVVSIHSKSGCDQPGGSATLYAGQRGMIQPSVEYAGCDDDFSYFGSLLYSQNDLAFSSATPGPDAIHDHTNQGQAFGDASYVLDAHTKLSLILSVADSDNQLPNVPGLAPQFALAGAAVIPSSAINSYLNFRDYLGIVSLSGAPTDAFSYELSYAMHSISQMYEPDTVGELLYQGVASQASHKDFDNTLQGDATYRLDDHAFGAGFYLGAYHVSADANTLVFPVDAFGNQTSDVPIGITNDAHATNMVVGLYADDLWQIDPTLRLNIGLRWDSLTGFSHGNQFSPSINLTYTPATDTAFHLGAARYFQVPSFEGISPKSPAAFMGTSGEGPSGSTLPLPEDDWEWDTGVVRTLMPGVTASADVFYEITRHYLDAGQFGVVPIFAPFNYDHGKIWGSEFAVHYATDDFSAYSNVTFGRNLEKGIATGQFNFTEPGELQYIDSNYIDLDHQPMLGITTGATYVWKPYSFSIDTIYTSGLRTGFANLQPLPNTFQVNVGIERGFNVEGAGRITDRLTFLNIFDRINLIRPSGGLGVFQSAYEPRFTVFNAITVPL